MTRRQTSWSPAAPASSAARWCGGWSRGGHRVVNLDKLTYAGNLGLAPRCRGLSPNYRFVQGDICDQRAGRRRCCASTDRRRSCTWPPKATSTARSTGRRCSSRPMSSAPSACSTRRSTYWRGLERRGRRRFPLPPYLDRRGVRRPAVRQRPVHRRDALRAVIALFGVQGGVRPSRPRLARNLWPARGALQLLEQLRAVSTSPRS